MSSYWEKRNEKLKEIKGQLKSDKDYKVELDRIYDDAMERIQKEIKSELMRYAGDDKLSLSKTLRKISTPDLNEYRKKLETHLKDDNLSKKAREEIKALNVDSRIRRNYLLSRNIELVTLSMADKENQSLTNKLQLEAIDRFRKTIGVLGETVPDPIEINRIAKRLVEADYKGTNYSNRVWANQRELQRGLESSLERIMIQGKSPLEGSRDLDNLVRENFENGKFAANRIAVTESARVQGQVQISTFEEYGVKEFEWIAEPDACTICSGYDGKVFKVNDPNAPSVPVHPFCRCSIIGHVDKRQINKPVKDEITKEEAWQLRKDEQMKKLGEFEEKKSIKEVNKYTTEVLGVDQAKFNGLDIRVANEINQSLHEHLVDFPELRDRIRFTGSTQQRNIGFRRDYRKLALNNLRNSPGAKDKSEEYLIKKSKEATNIVMGRLTPTNRVRAVSRSISDKHKSLNKYAGITFNNMIGYDYDSMMRTYKMEEKRKWKAKGTFSVKGTADHEIGHQLDSLLNIREIKEVQDLFDSRTKEELTNDLSIYSHKNNNSNLYSEMIAEGWAEYRNNPEPREIAKTIGEIIEREYKEQYVRGG